jgi:hypothetical protein
MMEFASGANVLADTDDVIVLAGSCVGMTWYYGQTGHVLTSRRTMGDIER